MEIGVGLPNTVAGVEAGTLIEWTRRADAGPFSTLGAIDRLAYPNFDALTCLTVAAGMTSRVRLMTTVLLAPLHRAEVLAKQVSTLNALSGGRLTLGMGIGARPEDYTAAGADFHARGEQLDTVIGRLRQGWEGARLILGGRSEKAYQRAARLGDGYISSSGVADEAQKSYQQVERYWRAAGRTGRPRFVVGFYWCLGDRDAAVAHIHRYYGFNPQLAQAVERSLADSPEAIRKRLREFAAVGVEEAVAWPCTTDLAQLDGLAQVVI